MCPPEPRGSRCRDSQSDIMWRESLIGGICQVLLIRESLARGAGKILGVRGDVNTRRTWPSESAKWDLMHSKMLKQKVQGLRGSAPCPLHIFWLLAQSFHGTPNSESWYISLFWPALKTFPPVGLSCLPLI